MPDRRKEVSNEVMHLVNMKFKEKNPPLTEAFNTLVKQ